MKHELNDSHLTRCVDLEAMLTEASTEETDIDSVLFENLTLEGGSYPGLTFRGCKFVGCRLSGCSLERAAWIDCMLEQCDLSNTQMIKGTMQRTKLTDCKLVGISLTEAFLLDSSIERCVARYANLYGSKMRHVRLTDSTSPAPRSPAARSAQRPSRGVCLSARSSLGRCSTAWIYRIATSAAFRSAAGNCAAQR